MRYYKIEKNGYITGIGKGDVGAEITKAEYNEIMSAIQNHPEETSSIGYRLKTDLTWEQYEKPPQPEPEPDAEELLSILTGGDA